MADVIPQTITPHPPLEREAASGTGAPLATPIYDVIELLFFGYRDFVGDADAVLERYGFGRAHHRVLHFVNRNPGLKVADLLDILKITKQSLGRVLRELIDKGFVEQREGRADRRQRLLFPTRKGSDLALELAELQTRRIAAALATQGPQAHQAAVSFLYALVDPDERAAVAAIVGLPPEMMLE